MATANSKVKARLSRNRPSKPATGRQASARKKLGIKPRKAGGGRGGRGRNQQGRAGDRRSYRSNPTRISGRFREFLASELGFLRKAQSLLECIANSMDDSTQPSTGPYYPDVLEVASDLIRRRAAELDDLSLHGRLLADTTGEPDVLW
jgi:hypothetical protein